MAGRRENNQGGVWWDEQRERWRGRYLHAGKEHFVTGKSKKEVTEKLAEFRNLPEPTEYTFRQAADKWMSVRIKPLCRRSTYEQYEHLLRNHIKPVIGDMRLENVTAQSIQEVISRMAEKNLSAGTMGHARKIIHVMYEWYVDGEVVESNPCKKIKIPKIPPAPRRSLSSREVIKLKETMISSRWGYSIDFLLLTGLRRGELLALKWDDVKDGWISISRSLTAPMEMNRPKSNAGCRRFRLPKAAVEVLKKQQLMLIQEGIRSDYVFPNITGLPMAPRNYSQAVMRIGRQAGLDFSVHELRHTFVSTLGSNINLQALQTILGHTKATHTLDIYGHLIDGALETAADKMDEVLAGKKPRKPRKSPTPGAEQQSKVVSIAG